MPPSISVAAFVFGATLLLVAISGGGFKIFGAEVSATVGAPMRLLAGIFGTLLLIAGFYLTLNPELSSEPDKPTVGSDSPSDKSTAGSDSPSEEDTFTAPATTQRSVEPTDSEWLLVNYIASTSGSDFYIGNQGANILVITEPTLHWAYRECPKFTESSDTYEVPEYRYTVTVRYEFVRMQVPEYRYTAKLSKSDGLKLLTSRSFKYSQGEVDRFVVNVTFPGRGIYTTWLTLRYNKLGDANEHSHQTSRQSVSVCLK